MSVPTVFTETVRADTGALGVDVPGSVQGLHETGIYARSNGFVRSLRVDIGSVVRKGDTLVVLDMPEVREQAQQAAAVLEQAEANAALARTTLARWQQLADQGVVTPQEYEERQAGANVAEATGTMIGNRTTAQPHVQHDEIDELLLAIVLQPPLGRLRSIIHYHAAQGLFICATVLEHH
jgi:multidrug efflux pump subunit AcrA (membrane-fusion protein)